MTEEQVLVGPVRRGRLTCRLNSSNLSLCAVGFVSREDVEERATGGDRGQVLSE